MLVAAVTSVALVAALLSVAGDAPGLVIPVEDEILVVLEAGGGPGSRGVAGGAIIASWAVDVVGGSLPLVASDTALTEFAAEDIMREGPGRPGGIGARVIGVAVSAIDLRERFVHARQRGTSAGGPDHRAPLDADAVEGMAAGALCGRRAPERGVTAQAVARDLGVSLGERPRAESCPRRHGDGHRREDQSP